MTELGKLIEAAKRANKRSMQEAADLAASLGVEISKSTISENSRKVETVTPLAVRGIAAGYDIPEEDVIRAMLADMGFKLGDYNPGVESAIRRDPDLSSEAKAMLLAAVSAARTSSRSVTVARNQMKHASWDGFGAPPGWLPSEDSSVLRDENGKDRHQSRG